MMNKLLDIYISFLKIGSFTIGGGYVMVPLIQDLAVNQKQWCEEDEVLEYITIAQSVPGMFGANVASNIGYKVKGIKGAISALLGMITPSFLITTIFASIYSNIMQYELVQNAFKGMQSAVVALILLTVVKLYKKSVKINFQRIILVSAVLLTLFINLSPFYLIVSGFLLGPIYTIITLKRK